MWGELGGALVPVAPAPALFFVSDQRRPALADTAQRSVSPAAVHDLPLVRVTLGPYTARGVRAAWRWTFPFLSRGFPYTVFLPGGPVQCHWAPWCHALHSRS